MIVATGFRSTIVQALRELMPTEIIEPVDWQSETVAYLADKPGDTRFVLAGGYMAGKRTSEQSVEEVDLSFRLNFEQPMLLASQALEELPGARIAIIGSWSAVNGSFDQMYAATKYRIHRWAQRQKVMPPQQLVVLAPPIIADSGMTTRRPDFPGILEARPHCFAMDVARAIRAALFEADPAAPPADPVAYLPATAGPHPWSLEVPSMPRPQ